MPLFRRLVPLLALLLSVVVVTQALDVVGCPDEEGAQHDTTSSLDFSGWDADCLCHLTYVAEDQVPILSETLLGWENVRMHQEDARQRLVPRRVERPPIG